MTRRYTQTTRRDQTLARRQQMIQAVFALIDRGSFGEVTLQGVADEAGVSLLPDPNIVTRFHRNAVKID